MAGIPSVYYSQARMPRTCALSAKLSQRRSVPRWLGSYNIEPGGLNKQNIKPEFMNLFSQILPSL
jgi:hypothetical protein